MNRGVEGRSAFANRQASSPVEGERTATPSAHAEIVETPEVVPGFLGVGTLSAARTSLPPVEAVSPSGTAEATRRYAPESLEPFKPLATGEIPVGLLVDEERARAWRTRTAVAMVLGGGLGVIFAALVAAAVLGLVVAG